MKSRNYYLFVIIIYQYKHLHEIALKLFTAEPDVDLASIVRKLPKQFSQKCDEQTFSLLYHNVCTVLVLVCMYVQYSILYIVFSLVLYSVDITFTTFSSTKKTNVQYCKLCIVTYILVYTSTMYYSVSTSTVLYVQVYRNSYSIIRVS